MTDKKNAKDIIIKAASRLFRTRGYYGVGLNEILKESGTAKGSLYYYFPNGKEELAIAAIDYTKEFVADKIRRALEKFEEPIQAFQAHINDLSEEFGVHKEIFGLPIGTIAGETSLTSEPIRLACQSAFECWQLIYVEKLLASGYSEKHAKELGLLINAMLEGGILLCLTTKSREPLRIIAEQIPFLLKK
ncbi:TetR/AcrR family transcriptional regulator [Filibacter tadaridae]|uniref:Putative HTH-type transcriptional regulator YxaF n=1 Tax=Filibacter tadaridae TaxID=2483811 RepID=A0A3P5X317_9BACL|nr:TetR/AcrR family transcriptional regulator [Filibacter tadaridae]VDC21584.1 putative HTH-type transcriptional regulator YxaF [Filibacter tadaridae]